MALTALLSGRNRDNLTIEADGIEPIEFDVSMFDQSEHNARVTQYPVEGGATITDHVQNDPSRWTVEGVVTNDPLRAFFAFQDADRVKTVAEALRNLRDRREPFSITTGLDEESGLVIESLTMPREPARGESMRIRMQLIQIRRVELERIQIEPDQLSEEVRDAAQGTTDAGEQSTNPLSELENSTTLNRFAESIGDLYDDLLE